MNSFDRQWQKLAAAARLAGDERGDAAPYGFAVRVAARGLAAPAENAGWFLERFAVRGLVIAMLFSASAAAFNYSAVFSDPADDYANVDSIDEMLDLS